VSVFDVDQFIAPVSDESPSGDNLEYEPEFGELERAAQGKPAHEIADEAPRKENPPMKWATKSSKRRAPTGAP
jgi:type VI secretion system protein ImpA